MSEPDSGSDLAAVRTRAVKAEGGWKISGTKVWTSSAHRAHYLIALVRTAPKEEDRHAGLTQFIVDLSHPGVSTRPIYNLYGGHDFNEVVFDEYFVADDMVMGEVGMGWKMVTGELAFERSGPDRFLSTYQLLAESIRKIGANPDDRSASEIGRFVAHLATLRRMSTSVAGMLEKGAQPNVEAALVKDIGTTFEREIPEMFRQLIPAEPTLGDGNSYPELLGMTMLRAPGFTIVVVALDGRMAFHAVVAHQIHTILGVERECAPGPVAVHVPPVVDQPVFDCLTNPERFVRRRAHLIIAPQRVASFWTKASMSSGDPPRGSAACARSACCTSGAAIAARND